MYHIVIVLLLSVAAPAATLPDWLRIRFRPRAASRTCEFSLRRTPRLEHSDFELTAFDVPGADYTRAAMNGGPGADPILSRLKPGRASIVEFADVSTHVLGLLKVFVEEQSAFSTRLADAVRVARVRWTPEDLALAEHALTYVRGDSGGRTIALDYHLLSPTIKTQLRMQRLWLLMPDRTFPRGILVATDVQPLHGYLGEIKRRLNGEVHDSAVLPFTVEGQP